MDLETTYDCIPTDMMSGHSGNMEWRISSSETIIMSQKMGDYPLQDREKSVPQVEELSSLGIFVTSEGNVGQEIQRWNGIMSTILQLLIQSFGVNRELRHRVRGSV